VGWEVKCYTETPDVHERHTLYLAEYSRRIEAGRRVLRENKAISAHSGIELEVTKVEKKPRNGEFRNSATVGA